MVGSRRSSAARARLQWRCCSSPATPRSGTSSCSGRERNVDRVLLPGLAGHRRRKPWHPGCSRQANALLRLVAQRHVHRRRSARRRSLVAAFGSGTAIAIDCGHVLRRRASSSARCACRRSLRHRGDTNFLADLAVGWKEFRARTWLWVIVLQFSFVNAVESGAFDVLGPVVAEEELGGARDWGLIVAAQAVGMVAGGLVGLRFQPRADAAVRRRSRSCSCPACCHARLPARGCP